MKGVVAPWSKSGTIREGELQARLDSPIEGPVAAVLRQRLDSIIGHGAHCFEHLSSGTAGPQISGDVLQQAADLASELNGLPLELLPANALNRLLPPITDLATTLQKFSTSPGEDSRYSAQAKYDVAFAVAVPYVAYLHSRHGHAPDSVRESAELLKKTLSETRQSLDDMRSKLKAHDAILQTLQHGEEQPTGGPDALSAAFCVLMLGGLLVFAWFYWMLSQWGIGR